MLEADVTLPRAPFTLDARVTVPAGTCLALAGPSGAGKSSLLRVIAGLTTPPHGVVRCDQETWLNTGTGVNLLPETRGCGYLFQDFALFPHLSAWQNVAYPMAGRGRRARALDLLDRFGLSERANSSPRQLSGGEQQRVALARVLARPPAALLLDEPLSALDPRTRASAAELLRSTIAETGVPTILVTHDFQQAAGLGTTIGIIDQGEIVQRGSASELAARPASSFVADFSGAIVLTGLASQGRDGLTAVTLDGSNGQSILSTEQAAGRVAVSVFPWEITLEPIGSPHDASSINGLQATVVSVTVLGTRARIGLDIGQPLVAETTASSAEQLGLEPGTVIRASWKAVATRLVAV